jgi:curved DNA-binding protein CbpA
MDPYEELGVARDATPEQIQAAHRKAAKRHHPDQGGDAEKFDRIQQAFAILRDPDKRRIFDETGSYDQQAQISFEQRSHVAARLALMSVVMGAQDLAKIDVVAGALAYLKAQIDGLEIQRQQFERNLGRLGLARARIRNVSDEDDVVARLFDFQESDLGGALPKVEEEIRVQRAAEAILTRYAYTFEIEGKSVSVSREGRTLNMTIGG